MRYVAVTPNGRHRGWGEGGRGVDLPDRQILVLLLSWVLKCNLCQTMCTCVHEKVHVQWNLFY